MNQLETEPYLLNQTIETTHYETRTISPYYSPSNPPLLHLV